MRKPHKLSRVHSRAMPRELIVFDTETKPVIHDDGTEEHVLVFGWAFYSRMNDNGNWGSGEWLRFTKPQQLWYFITDHARPKNQLYTFCHNANFDWQVSRMCQVMPDEGWRCDKAIIEDPPNCFVWCYEDRKITCLDTTNFWPQRLSEIGERLGIAKLSMPEDWSDVEVSDAYCKRDVEIVFRALLDWFKWLTDHDLGKFCISKASQAFCAYRHRFMDHDIHIHDNEKALLLERESYMGGRTEAWTVGIELKDLVEVDINSQYPAVMRDNDYPVKLMGVYKSPTKQEITDWLEKYCIVARCWIRCSEPIYPLRTKLGVMFPIGTFRTTLTTPEIRIALERGELMGVTLASVYEKAPIFVRFIDELYALRLEFSRAGDETAKYNTKVMINSLYGKYGQRGGHDEIVGYTDDLSFRAEDEIDVDTGKRYRVRYIGGVIMSRSLDEEARDSFPAIAAHVTAYGRLKLWEFACIVGCEHVHYMDTDSLHIASSALDRLLPYIDTERLGAMKISKTIATAFYRGPKDYTLDAVTKIKGVRKTAVEIEPGVFEQDQWVSIRGSVAAGHTGGPLVRKVRKHLKRIYRKGTVTESGRVAPFVLNWQP